MASVKPFFLYPIFNDKQTNYAYRFYFTINRTSKHYYILLQVGSVGSTTPKARSSDAVARSARVARPETPSQKAGGLGGLGQKKQLSPPLSLLALRNC